jgi:hypothetical protein
MDDALLESVILSQVGRDATVSRYDRSLKSRVNFVLDVAQQQLGQEFAVYWVEGGVPEISCITGPSQPAIIYCTRYVELMCLVHNLFTLPLEDFRGELAERVFLKIMAELAIRYHHPGLAIRAFLQSTQGENIWSADMPGITLFDLSCQPIDEASVAMAVYGLIHEIGHLSEIDMARAGHAAFTTEEAIQALELALRAFVYSDERKKEIVNDARTRGDDFILSPARLMAEASADAFAFNVLFRSTWELMNQHGARPMSLSLFVQEMVLFTNTIAALERCKRIAILADGAIGPREQEEASLSRICFHVRALLARKYIDFDIACVSFATRTPSKEQMIEIQEFVNAENRRSKDVIECIDKSLAAAVRFAIIPQERNPYLMTAFANDILQAKNPLHRSQAVEFCELAESFHETTESVRAIRRIANAPSFSVTRQNSAQ